MLFIAHQQGHTVSVIAAALATTPYLLEGFMAANSILLGAVMGGDVLLEDDMTANAVLLEGNLS